MPKKKEIFIFLFGLSIGCLLGSTFSSIVAARVVVDTMELQQQHNHKFSSRRVVCEEKDEEYWYVRKRTPFLGPLKGPAFEVYDNCMPRRMRYEFTLNGTIPVNGNLDPKLLGDPAEFRLGISPSQVYGPLTTTHKDLFGARNGSSIIWSKELLQYLIGEVAAGKDISCKDYPQSAMDIKYALELLQVGPEDRLLVGGSISPWVEAVALHANVGSVTTVDYSVPQCDNCHPRLQTVHMDTLMRKSTSPAGYSHIISYSSIEHDGLGRYGDPIDPYGDQHAMNEFWSLLRVGGILLLAVPLWEKDELSHLLARLYGPIRLPWLIRGWEYLGCVNHGVWSAKVPLHPGRSGWGWHPIIALRKTRMDIQPVEAAGSLCTLDCTNSNLAENKHLGFNACRPSPSCNDLTRHWPGLQKSNTTVT